MNKGAYLRALQTARAIKKSGQTRRRVDAWFPFMKAALRG